MMGNQSNRVVTKIFLGLHMVGRVLETFFYWALTLAVLEVIVITTVSLGPRIGLMTMIVAPLSALPVAIGLTLITAGRASHVQKSKQHYSGKTVGPLVVLTSPMVAASLSPTVVDHYTRSEDADAALQSFEPTYASDVEPAKVERTLAEFERARRQLAD